VNTDKPVSPFSTDAGSPGSEVMLFGHRGYSALAPENTLAAFSLLLEHGIPGVELDVRLSGDGKVVVIHDENVKRVTGVDALVQECRASRLKRMDAGSWFGEPFKNEGIPQLDEVFELAGDRLYYDIELKWVHRESGGLEQAVVSRIRSHRMSDRCLISSFNPFCIRRIQAMAPDIPTAHTYARYRRVPLLLRRGQAGVAIPTPYMKPRWSQVNLFSSFILRRMLRSRILTWTVDDPQEATRLIHLGVKGIISNHPSKIKAVLLR
jgi:glycerophosphoryl diester phosphodiesterase